MTGNQLGRAIGLNKAFGTRITQYETNARDGQAGRLSAGKGNHYRRGIYGNPVLAG